MGFLAGEAHVIPIRSKGRNLKGIYRQEEHEEASLLSLDEFTGISGAYPSLRTTDCNSQRSECNCWLLVALAPILCFKYQ